MRILERTTKESSYLNNFMTNYKEFSKQYPISQNKHSGLFGFERVYNCLNLNKCIYKTVQQAGKDRKLKFNLLKYT